MNALAFTRKPGSRLPELSPFDLKKADERGASQQGPKGLEQAPTPGPGPAYGCVEWFHYLDRPPAEAAVPGAARRQR